MTKEELEKATGQELIDERDYCGVDGYYGAYLDNVNAEMLKRFNRLSKLEKKNKELQEKLDFFLTEKVDGKEYRPKWELEKLQKELKNAMNNNIKWGAELADAREIIIRFYRYIFLREDFLELNDFNVWKNKAEAFLKE